MTRGIKASEDTELYPAAAECYFEMLIVLFWFIGFSSIFLTLDLEDSEHFLFEF